MNMKSIWNGFISFGMVNIPVKLYSAISQASRVNFRLLYAKDNTPVHYQRWSEVHEEEVPWGDVVKGVEMDDGSYYVFTKEELDRLRPERSDTIEIHEFVDGDQIDGIYLDRPYFLGPGKERDKPYHLFMEALRSTDRVAIGKFVMREREHLAAIEPYGEGLLLTTLNYAYELRNINEIEGVGEKPDLSEKELDLAEQLIERMSSGEFDITRYEDGYMERLKEAIEGKDEVVSVEVEPEGTSEENLIDSLRSSLEA